MLKMMMAVPMAGLASPFAAFAAHGAQTLPAVPSSVSEDASAYQPKILTPQEWKTIHALSDWILPADEVSGSAIDAGVPEFIDDWLDFQRGDLLVEIRYGLAWLDAECGRSTRHSFVECATAEQKQILDRIAYPQKAAPGDARAVAFFNQMRDLAISGFYTSEMGTRDLSYIGNEPQFEWKGCPASALAKLGV